MVGNHLIAQLLPAGRPIRYLLSDVDVDQFGHLSHRCGNCWHACNRRADVQVAWCSLHRLMTSSTTPVLCERFRSQSSGPEELGP